MFDITPEDEDITPQPPHQGSGCVQGKGELDLDSPLKSRRGVGERSTEE